MVDVFASVYFSLHHKVQKFSSGTGSPGWSQKTAVKRLWLWWLYVSGILGTRLVSGDDEDAHIEDAVAVVSLAVSQLHQQQVNLTAPPSTCDEVTRWDSGVKILRYVVNIEYTFR